MRTPGAISSTKRLVVRTASTTEQIYTGWATPRRVTPRAEAGTPSAGRVGEAALAEHAGRVACRLPRPGGRRRDPRCPQGDKAQYPPDEPVAHGADRRRLRGAHRSAGESGEILAARTRRLGRGRCARAGAPSTAALAASCPIRGAQLWCHSLVRPSDPSGFVIGRNSPAYASLCPISAHSSSAIRVPADRLRSRPHVPRSSTCHTAARTRPVHVSPRSAPPAAPRPRLCSSRPRGRPRS